MRYVVLCFALVATLFGLGLLAISRLNGLSTRAEPSAPERILAGTARRWAVPREAGDARNPVAFSTEVWAESRAHFADHCASCHANDGSGQTELGQNLYPKAPDMRLAATQALSDGELYWIIKNGVRMTGMPAWGAPGNDDPDTWKLVHFIRHVKELTAEDLEEMQAFNPISRAELEEERKEEAFLAGEDPAPAPPRNPHHHDKEIK